MYWLFTEDQVKKAMKAFVERTCADKDEEEATARLIAEFLTSPEADFYKIVQGNQDASSQS